MCKSRSWIKKFNFKWLKKKINVNIANLTQSEIKDIILKQEITQQIY